MRLTAQLKLTPSPEQADALLRTLVRANKACDYISRVAWETQTFRQFPIHRLTYGAVRATFELAAQLTVRCIAKVSDAYKLDTKHQRTHGSRRRLRKLAGQERRFAAWVNHNLSRRIVAKAERTKRAIALEDLTHIRTRVRARRSQRTTLHSWSFLQLRIFIAYKAALAGVPVHFVDPCNTSRTCPSCGCIDKANHKTQASLPKNGSPAA